MKKVKIFFLSLFAMSMMASCSDSDKNWSSVKYLAVQLEKGEDWSIIDSKGEIIVKEEYSRDCEVSPILKDLYWVKDEEGYHLYHIDNPKMPLTQDVYEYATLFFDGRAAVAKHNEPIKIINEKGEVVKELDENIFQVSHFSDGLATFIDAKSKKTGYIDRNGEIVIEAKYAGAFSFYKGLAFVIKNEDDKKILIIDKSAKEKGSFNVDNLVPLAFYFKDGMSPMWDTKTDKLVFIDETGQSFLKISGSAVMTESFQNVGQQRNGLIIYTNKNQEYGLVNKEGKVIIRPKYSHLGWVNDKMLFAEKNDKYGLIDTEDNTIVDFEYSFALPIQLNENPIFEEDNTYYIYGIQKKKILNTEFYRLSLSDASGHAKYIKPEPATETEESDDAFESDSTAELATDSVTAASVEETSPEVEDYAFLSTRLVTEGDIARLSKAEIRVLRNAIFARHGYIFNDQKLAEHFKQFPWYTPRSKNVAGEFNNIEQQNVAFLKAHE